MMSPQEVQEVHTLVVELFPHLGGQAEGMINFRSAVASFEVSCALTAVRAFHLSCEVSRPTFAAIMRAIRSEVDARARVGSSFSAQLDEGKTLRAKMREATIESARCLADNRRWLESVSESELDALIADVAGSGLFWLSEALSVASAGGGRRPITAAQLRAQGVTMKSQILQGWHSNRQEHAHA